MGWDCIVGVATCYGLDGLRIKFRWGATFPTPVQTSPGTYPASCRVGTRYFSWGKASVVWNWPPTPCNTAI